MNVIFGLRPLNDMDAIQLGIVGLEVRVTSEIGDLPLDAVSVAVRWATDEHEVIDEVQEDPTRVYTISVTVTAARETAEAIRDQLRDAATTFRTLQGMCHDIALEDQLFAAPCTI